MDLRVMRRDLLSRRRKRFIEYVTSLCVTLKVVQSHTGVVAVSAFMSHF